MDILFLISDSIGAFFTMVGAFVTDGIYDFWVWAASQLIELFTLAALNFALWALPFAWEVAKQIIVDLNLSAMIQAAWGQLDSSVLGYATALRISESVNLLISAFVTRFVLRFIPFI